MGVRRLGLRAARTAARRAAAALRALAARLEPDGPGEVRWRFTYTCGTCGQVVTSSELPHSHGEVAVRASVYPNLADPDVQAGSWATAVNGTRYDPDSPQIQAAMAAAGPLIGPVPLRLVRDE